MHCLSPDFIFFSKQFLHLGKCCPKVTGFHCLPLAGSHPHFFHFDTYHPSRCRSLVHSHHCPGRWPVSQEHHLPCSHHKLHLKNKQTKKPNEQNQQTFSMSFDSFPLSLNKTLISIECNSEINPSPGIVPVGLCGELIVFWIRILFPVLFQGCYFLSDSKRYNI